MPRSAGNVHLGIQIVPLPVSFSSMGFSEMLKVDVLDPRPRLNDTYVHGWWKSMTKEPPSNGHAVRLLFDSSVVLTFAPALMVRIPQAFSLKSQELRV
jgi:hypothetical protein